MEDNTITVEGSYEKLLEQKVIYITYIVYLLFSWINYVKLAGQLERYCKSKCYL